MGFKVVAFCYSWAADRKLDAYQQSLLEAFTDVGAEVHVILSNYMADYQFLYGIRPEVSQQKIVEYINKLNADLVLSINHGGMSIEIQTKVNCPTITWLVDDLSHIFYPDRWCSMDEMFTSNSHVIVSSVQLYNILKIRAPSLNKRLLLLPSATNVESFRNCNIPFKHNISFVGSYLETNEIEKIVLRFAADPNFIESLKLAVTSLSENFQGDFKSLLLNSKFKDGYIKKNFDLDKFKMLIANAISNNERSQIVQFLGDLGLKIFGNFNWLSLISTNINILNCYQFREIINTHKQLVEIYQSSRISINVPQIQVGPALPYRVIDILASKSLLITKYHPQSDANTFFGENNPIVMYKDMNHLRELSQYYLANELDRMEIVEQCNHLVEKGFSFSERISTIMDLAKCAKSDGSVPGKIIFLKENCFDVK